MVRGLALVALACWAAAGSQAFLLPAGRPPTSTATCLRAAAAAAPQTVVAAAAEGSSTGGGSKAASQARYAVGWMAVGVRGNNGPVSSVVGFGGGRRKGHTKVKSIECPLGRRLSANLLGGPAVLR